MHTNTKILFFICIFMHLRVLILWKRRCSAEFANTKNIFHCCDHFVANCKGCFTQLYTHMPAFSIAKVSSTLL